jgi:hypothetical protein
MAIIGISGRKGVGKNTVASIIQYLIWKDRVEKGELKLVNYALKDFMRPGFIGGNLSNWEQKSFADKLKKIVSILTKIPVIDLEDQDVKDRVLGKEWTKVDIIPDNPDEEWTPTVRWLLQTLGTDVMRDVIHPDIWINALFVDYVALHNGKWNQGYDTYEKPNWLITDLRFPNEIVAIKQRGGITIRVIRDLHKGNAHISPIPHKSETSLDDAEFDFVIDNNSDLFDLTFKVKAILKKLKML